MDSREERLAANEVLFREINEQIGKVAEQLSGDGHRYSFICECSNADCTVQISLTLDAYEAVRSHGSRFVVAKGHAMPDIERVVDSRDGYDVVEKQDEAAEYAEAHDPRAP